MKMPSETGPLPSPPSERPAQPLPEHGGSNPSLADDINAESPTPATLPAPTTSTEGAVRLIALIFSLAACWLARDLLVPVMLAMLLALLANPMVTRLHSFWIPRWISALIVVLGGLALAVTLASMLVNPATEWIKQAPNQLRELAPKLRSLTKKVEQANKAAASIVSATGAAPAASAVAADAEKPRAPNLWSVVTNAPRVLASVLAVVLLSYFFLVYGDGLQRHAIARLSRTEHKKLAIDILRTIEADVSSYVLTISLINVFLGLLLTGGLFWLGLDMSDALLWGTLAALLNFVPYVGPLSGVIALALVGVVAFDQPAQMLVPPALYLGLHVCESQFVTPIILGRRMAISPLVLLLWLMLWGFLWGVAGLLLAVPMLAAIKIVAERVEGWEGWAKVIE